MAVRVQREAFDVAAEVAALTRGRVDIGGIVTFSGLVRGPRCSVLRANRTAGDS